MFLIHMCVVWVYVMSRVRQADRRPLVHSSCVAKASTLDITRKLSNQIVSHLPCLWAPSSVGKFNDPLPLRPRIRVKFVKICVLWLSSSLYKTGAHIGCQGGCLVGCKVAGWCLGCLSRRVSFLFTWVVFRATG